MRNQTCHDCPSLMEAESRGILLCEPVIVNNCAVYDIHYSYVFIIYREIFPYLSGAVTTVHDRLPTPGRPLTRPRVATPGPCVATVDLFVATPGPNIATPGHSDVNSSSASIALSDRGTQNLPSLSHVVESMDVAVSAPSARVAASNSEGGDAAPVGDNFQRPSYRVRRSTSGIGSSALWTSPSVPVVFGKRKFTCRLGCLHVHFKHKCKFCVQCAASYSRMDGGVIQAYVG